MLYFIIKYTRKEKIIQLFLILKYKKHRINKYFSIKGWRRMFERLKKTAKEKGYSLHELADKAGLGAGTIYSWKNKTPSIKKLSKVASILGVTTDYLLKGEENKVNIEPILNANQLYMKDKALSDRDRKIIQNILKGVLESTEGQERLKDRGYTGESDD